VISFRSVSSGNGASIQPSRNLHSGASSQVSPRRHCCFPASFRISALRARFSRKYRMHSLWYGGWCSRLPDLSSHVPACLDVQALISSKWFSRGRTEAASVSRFWKQPHTHAPETFGDVPGTSPGLDDGKPASGSCRTLASTDSIILLCTDSSALYILDVPNLSDAIEINVHLELDSPILTLPCSHNVRCS
jgi:hypothetical protein